MASAKFINFVAIVSFAVFYISLTPISANALAVERAHVARNLNYAHAGIAKKKRDNHNPSKRCKPRPTSSSLPPSTTPPPAYTPSSPSPSPQPSSSSTPTSSSSSSSYSPSATPATSSGMGKVGIDWSNNEEGALCNFKTNSVTHVYDWKMFGYGSIVNPSSCGITYMPMIWGPQNLGQIAGTLVEGYANIVLCYNEPDQPGQANVDVDTAVGQFMQYINQLQYIGYKIASPACTNSPAGFAWIQDFVSKVRGQGGKLDFIATHVYTTDSNYFIQFMDGFVKAFSGDQIMLTEYAAMDYSGANQQLDANGITAYVQATNAYLKNKPEIVYAAYFGFMTASELQANNVNPLNSLMNDDGTPNALGEMIINP